MTRFNPKYKSLKSKPKLKVKPNPINTTCKAQNEDLQPRTKAHIQYLSKPTVQ